MVLILLTYFIFTRGHVLLILELHTCMCIHAFFEGLFSTLPVFTPVPLGFKYCRRGLVSQHGGLAAFCGCGDYPPLPPGGT